MSCMAGGLRTRIKTLAPRLQGLPNRLSTTLTPSAARLTGRKLQARRFKVWTKDPHCACCRRLTVWPSGFHLDHITALINGGPDIESNCQVLCLACHEKKTADDMKEARGLRT